MGRIEEGKAVMPTYDYRCEKCDSVVEVVHSIHREEPCLCEVCGEPMLRGMGIGWVQYKGAGWARKEKGTGDTDNIDLFLGPPPKQAL